MERASSGILVGNPLSHKATPRRHFLSARAWPLLERPFGRRWGEGRHGDWGREELSLSQVPTDVGSGPSMGLRVCRGVGLGSRAHLCVLMGEVLPRGVSELGGRGLFLVPSRALACWRERWGPREAPGWSDLVASHRCHPHGGTHRPRRAQRHPGCRAPQLRPEQPRPVAGAPAPLRGEGRQAAAEWGATRGRGRRGGGLAGGGAESDAVPNPFSPLNLGFPLHLHGSVW